MDFKATDRIPENESSFLHADSFSNVSFPIALKLSPQLALIAGKHQSLSLLSGVLYQGQLGLEGKRS